MAEATIIPTEKFEERFADEIKGVEDQSVQDWKDDHKGKDLSSGKEQRIRRKARAELYKAISKDINEKYTVSYNFYRKKSVLKNDYSRKDADKLAREDAFREYGGKDYSRLGLMPQFLLLWVGYHRRQKVFLF